MSGDAILIEATQFEFDNNLTWDTTKEMGSYTWTPETTLREKENFEYLECPVDSSDQLWPFLTRHNLFETIPVFHCVYDTYTSRVYNEYEDLLPLPHHRVTHRVVDFPVLGHVEDRDVSSEVKLITYASHRMMHRYLKKHRNYYGETVNLSEITDKITLVPIYGLDISMFRMETHAVDWGIAMLHGLNVPIPAHDLRDCVGGFVAGDVKTSCDPRNRFLRKIREIQCQHQGKNNLEINFLRSITEKYFPGPRSYISFRDD